MRENKWIIWICLPLTVGSLCLAICLTRCGADFWCNVLLGIFGSGLLTTMVAAVNYWSIRRRTLEAFRSYGHKAINNLNRYSADDDLDTAIDVFLQMAEFDYQPFDDAFGEMCFFFHDKKLHKQIYERIYGPIMEVRQAIIKGSFHFKQLKKMPTANQQVTKSFVYEIDKLLIERKTYHGDGTSITISEARTYKVHNLRAEFKNYFYYIMYPWKKKEATKDAH